MADRSTNSWPGFKADLLENDALSWASSALLSECVTTSDQGYSHPCHPRPRGERHCPRPSAGRGIKIRSSCHRTSAPRAVLDTSSWVSWTVKRLSCGPIVVGLALPILAHKPDAKLRSSLRLGLITSGTTTCGGESCDCISPYVDCL